MRICNYCGAENQNNEKVCRNCKRKMYIANSNYRADDLHIVNSIPERYRPLSAWAYFAYGLLFSIPIAGFIFLIVFSLSDSNINRRNYARSYFCSLVLLLTVAAVIFVISLISGVSLFGFFE